MIKKLINKIFYISLQKAIEKCAKEFISEWEICNWEAVISKEDFFRERIRKAPLKRSEFSKWIKKEKELKQKWLEGFQEEQKKFEDPEYCKKWESNLENKSLIEFPIEDELGNKFIFRGWGDDKYGTIKKMKKENFGKPNEKD